MKTLTHADTAAAGALPHLPGLDRAGQEYLTHAYHSIHPFFVDELGADEGWNDMPDLHTRQTLLDRFRAFERRACRPDAPIKADRERALAVYREQYLLPIAEALGLVEQRRSQVIRSLVRRGQLVPPKKLRMGKSHMADSSHLTSWFFSLWNDTSTTKQLRAQLVDSGICRDEPTAGHILDLVDGIKVQAAALARGIILAGIDHGRVGLLQSSGHPSTDTLLYLQRQADHIAELTADPQRVLGILRADLIALQQTLSAFSDTRRSPLWKFQLLHLPTGNHSRSVAQQYLDSLKAEVSADLVQRRNCSPDEANELLHRFIRGGLADLIDWRCHYEGRSSEQDLATLRIEQAVRSQLAALPPLAQQRAIELLLHLREACRETGVTLPIVTLISQHPSSIYRVRLGRRIWFGVGASVSRRQRAARRRGKKRWEKLPRPQSQPDQPSPEDLLVSAFVRRANLKDLAEGRNIIRNLITYGGFGLFQRAEWVELVDSRVRSFLSFFKAGMPDGALDWSAMMNRLRAYAGEQGFAAPSSQVTRAIFNSVPKPPGWHGGYGEDVATIRQRVTLVLRAPCLHDSWVVLQARQRLAIELIDEQGQLISRSAVVLAVFDEHVERPVAVWVSGEPEVGLVLHQALWHPGNPNWPLRGIPRVIKVADNVLKDQRLNVKRAADWMQSDLQVLTPVQYTRQRDKMARAEDLLLRMVTDGARLLKSTLNTRRMTQRIATDALLNWMTLQDEKGGRCFPNHRVPVLPPSSITFGKQILPGYDLPPAGWLLPIVGQTQTQRNRVIYRGSIYTSANFRIEPGLTVKLRALPFLSAAVPNHLFIEEESGRLTCLASQKPAE